MSFTRFEFTKKWTNAYDPEHPEKYFPTYEENETQVREDMQCLYDELKVALNGLMTALENVASAASGAASVGVSTIPGLEGYNTVQDALAGLREQIAGITIEGVGDHTVSSVKLTRKTDPEGAAVDTDNLKAASVGTTELKDSSVTGAKTDFSAGLTIGGTLNQQGKIILDDDCFGDELPDVVTPGRLFFKKVGEEEE